MTAQGGDQDVLLSLEGVSKRFDVSGGGLLRRKAELTAVDHVSLEIRRGETLGLVGESGCGKSTLARCVAKLIEVNEGTIHFEGHDLTRLSRRAMQPYRREIQMIFQDPYGSLNPRRRVGSIIGDAFAIHKVASGAERRRRVQELMEVVGLNPEHYNRFPADFSGGQRQRIGIARALALRPKLIICDEAVSALDVSIQAQVLNLLKSLQREFDLTYLFISHDLSVVRHLSDRVAVMYLGRVVEVAETDELFAASQHPYTRALLSAVPIAEPGSTVTRERIVLSGDLPSPMSPPPGCRFHPRCPKALPDCAVRVPALAHEGDRPAGHLVECLYPLKPNDELTSFRPQVAGTIAGTDVVDTTATPGVSA